MRVVHLNTYKNFGGAAVAGNRTVNALNSVYPDLAVMLNADEPAAVKSKFGRIIRQLSRKINFVSDVLLFSLYQANPAYKFRFSIAAFGENIHQLKEVTEADIIHIHWVNQGFLSLNSLQKLLKLNKPVVWTLHDMWPFTGGCHYSGSCNHFINQCGNCFYLKHPEPNDLSFKIRRKKQAIFSNNSKIAFSACSNWLATMAKSSSIAKDLTVLTIPNPINTNVFVPKDKNSLRLKYGLSPQKKIILFGASNIREERKGLKYLITALELLKKQSKYDVEVVIFGKNKGFEPSLVPFKTHLLGSIGNEENLADIYNLADVFVLPSLEDNLPNMVMEALSCGIPALAFDTGGLPDLITHKVEGYLAKLMSEEDLCNGISWILDNNKNQTLSLKAREKVISNFSNEVIANRYYDLYTSLLNKK